MDTSTQAPQSCATAVTCTHLVISTIANAKSSAADHKNLCFQYWEEPPLRARRTFAGPLRPDNDVACAGKGIKCPTIGGMQGVTGSERQR